MRWILLVLLMLLVRKTCPYRNLIANLLLLLRLWDNRRSKILVPGRGSRVPLLLPPEVVALRQAARRKGREGGKRSGRGAAAAASGHQLGKRLGRQHRNETTPLRSG